MNIINKGLTMMKKLILLLEMALLLLLIAAVIVLRSPYAPPVEPMMEIEALWAIEDAREESDAPLVTALENFGVPLGFDRASNTFYCTLGLDNGEAWPEVKLTVPGAKGVTVCFVDDYTYDWCSDAIAEGYSYEMMAYNDTHYSYFSMVFTGLPQVILHAPQELSLTETMGECTIATGAEGAVASAGARVRMRGDGSYRYLEKKSYKVEFTRGARGSATYQVPGIGATDELILLSMGFDDTFMHDKLSWDVLSRVFADKEVFPPRPTAYCEVFVNDEYTGLYVMSTPFDLASELTKENGEGLYHDSVYRTTNPQIIKERPVVVAQDGPAYELFHTPDGKQPFEGISNYLAMRDAEDDETFAALAKNHLDIDSTLLYTVMLQAMGLTDNTTKNMYIWEHVGADGHARYRFELWDMDLGWDRDIGMMGDYWYANKVHDRLINQDIGGARQRFLEIWEEVKARGFTLSLIEELVYQYEDELSRSGAPAREIELWWDDTVYLKAASIVENTQMRIDWMDRVTAYIADTQGDIPFLDVGEREEKHLYPTRGVLEAAQ